jgi:hypothetical protein
VRFWFTPADPVGLHSLRVLAGLYFLFWLLPFAGHLEPFFGGTGLFDLQAYHDVGRIQEGIPAPIGWSLLDLFGEGTVLTGFYALSSAVLVLFTLGIWPRVTAVLTWLIMASFTANPALAYEADALLMLLAFYLMIGYLLLGQQGAAPLSWRLLGPAWPFGDRADDQARWRCESLGANVAVRLLQVHFAIVMVVLGLHKLQFPDWWEGFALWYPLHPPLKTKLADIRTVRPVANAFMLILSVPAYARLAWELAFPLFAWRRGWLCRTILFAGAALECLLLGWTYGLPGYTVIFICCLGFLKPREWHWLRGKVTSPFKLALRLQGRQAAVASTGARRGVGEPSSLAAPR